MSITLSPPEKGTLLDKVVFHQQKASQAVAEALTTLKKEWKLSDVDVASFLHISRTTVNHWLRANRVPVEPPGSFTPDTETVLHLLAIHRSLFAMFSSPVKQKAWLETRHPGLGEAPAVSMRRSVEGLIQIRRYLDYVRGRGA